MRCFPVFIDIHASMLGRLDTTYISASRGAVTHQVSITNFIEREFEMLHVRRTAHDRDTRGAPPSRAIFRRHHYWSRNVLCASGGAQANTIHPHKKCHRW